MFTLLNSCLPNLTGFTLLNKDTFNRVNIKPLRGLAEFAFSYSPHPLSFSKEKGDAKIVLFNCSPSLIQLEKGNKRG